MLKRTVASTVGAIAVFASLIALCYPIQGIDDFRNPAVPFRFAVIGELLLCSMAAAALGLGLHLLRFGWSAWSGRSGSWVRPVVLGVGFFFPGFVFSLPLTILWARFTWPGDGQSALAAMEVSVYIGIAAAIICCIVLLKRRKNEFAAAEEK